MNVNYYITQEQLELIEHYKRMFELNAETIQELCIGQNCAVGAGTVVIKNIPDCAVVVGNPGRVVKYNS